MSETKTIWHPFPKEKPTEEKQYLISFYVCEEKRSGVDIDFYNPEHDVWDVYDDGAYTRVTAWAELPEPYNRRNNNDERRLAPSES